MNPFGEEDTAYTFPHTNSRNELGLTYPTHNSAFTPQYSDIQQRVLDSKSRTIESQQRALASLANSEEIGITTAEELQIQGEKIKNAEHRLDEISNIQKQSQGQINSLTSVFGGLKNLFYRKSLTSSPPIQANQPAVPSYPPSVSTRQIMSEPEKPQSDIDKNLAVMSQGMSRLKSLALSLDTELKAQNEQLDRMAPKLEKVNQTTVYQTNQLNTLLGNKKQSA